MPELNKVVDQYQNENIQFLSLALDDKKRLIKFLEKITFNYAVLPNQKDLIQNKLKLRDYPTHLVVDNNGSIVKVFNKGSELIEYLNKYDKVKIKNSNSKLLAPPLPPITVSDNNKNDA